MIPLDKPFEKTIIFDNLSFAANFRETLLKEKGRLLGVSVRDMRTFVGELLTVLDSGDREPLVRLYLGYGEPEQRRMKHPVPL